MSTSGDGGGEPTSGTTGVPGHGNEADYRAYVYVVLMVILGSTTAAAARYIVRELPVVWVPVVRFGVAGLCLLPVVRDLGFLGRILRRDTLLILASAALAVPVNQGFFLNAARLGPTSHVGLFYATCPLVVLFLAWMMRLERPDLGRLWGVLASVLGVVIIGVGSAWTSGGLPAETRAVVMADLLLIGAVLSWGGYLAVSKPLIMRHGSLPVLAATFLLGSLLDLPFALWASPEVPDFTRVSSTAWTALAFLTLFITPVNLACQNLALRRLDASQVANFSNISPILTVVWGALLFAEAMTPSLILGGALTLAGVIWTGRRRPRELSGQWRKVPSRPPDAPQLLRVVSSVSTGR